MNILHKNLIIKNGKKSVLLKNSGFCWNLYNTILSTEYFDHFPQEHNKNTNAACQTYLTELRSLLAHSPVNRIIRSFLFNTTRYICFFYICETCQEILIHNVSVVECCRPNLTKSYHRLKLSAHSNNALRLYQ